MFKDTEAFSGFSVDDIEKARHFYGEILGLEVKDSEMSSIELRLAGGTAIFVYPKGEAHTPASFTILNFLVKNIDEVVHALVAKGVTFEQYSGEIQTDEKGIARGAEKNMGPNIAWFKDPAGNTLSLIEDHK